MVKGVHKRIVEIKINGSKLYDHACLVFKSGDVASLTNEREMIEEANRIIGEVGANDGRRKRRRRSKLACALLCLLCLIIGIAVGLSVGIKL
jgi:hypothetical protein